MYGASWWKVQSSFTVEAEDQIRLAGCVACDRVCIEGSAASESKVLQLQKFGRLCGRRIIQLTGSQWLPCVARLMAENLRHRPADHRRLPHESALTQEQSER
jgi:hypothetical protein